MAKAQHRVKPAPWPQAPAPHVPLVRDWFTPAMESWTRFWWGGSGRTIIWGGCLLWMFVIALQALRLTLYLSGVIVLGVLFFLTALWDVGTYHWRRKAA